MMIHGYRDIADVYGIDGFGSFIKGVGSKAVGAGKYLGGKVVATAMLPTNVARAVAGKGIQIGTAFATPIVKGTLRTATFGRLGGGGGSAAAAAADAATGGGSFAGRKFAGIAAAARGALDQAAAAGAVPPGTGQAMVPQAAQQQYPIPPAGAGYGGSGGGGGGDVAAVRSALTAEEQGGAAGAEPGLLDKFKALGLPLQIAIVGGLGFGGYYLYKRLGGRRSKS
jgi:hypothetical protein